MSLFVGQRRWHVRHFCRNVGKVGASLVVLAFLPLLFHLALYLRGAFAFHSPNYGYLRDHQGDIASKSILLYSKQIILFKKMYYTDGFPKSDLRQFIANDDCVDNTPVYESQNCFPQLWSLLTRRRRGYEVIGDDQKDDDDEEEEQRPILAWAKMIVIHRHFELLKFFADRKRRYLESIKKKKYPQFLFETHFFLPGTKSDWKPYDKLYTICIYVLVLFFSVFFSVSEADAFSARKWEMHYISGTFFFRSLLWTTKGGV